MLYKGWSQSKHPIKFHVVFWVTLNLLEGCFLTARFSIDLERRWRSSESPLFLGYGSHEERFGVHMHGGRPRELVLEVREP